MFLEKGNVTVKETTAVNYNIMASVINWPCDTGAFIRVFNEEGRERLMCSLSWKEVSALIAALESARFDQ